MGTDTIEPNHNGTRKGRLIQQSRPEPKAGGNILNGVKTWKEAVVSICD